MESVNSNSVGVKSSNVNSSEDIAEPSSENVHGAKADRLSFSTFNNKKQTVASGRGKADIPEIIITTSPDDNPSEDQLTCPISPVRFRKKSVDEIERLIDPEYRYSHFLIDVPEHMTPQRKRLIGNEKEITEAELRLAATLVHDAMEGLTADIKTESKYVNSYNLYKKWPLTLTLYIAIIVNLSLVLFEEPAPKSSALPLSVTMSIELVCLLYFCFRTAHHFYWRRTQLFLRDLKNIIIIVIIAVTFIDMLVYIIWKHVAPDANHVRFSRALRAVIIVNFSDGRQIRRAWRNMRRTIKETVHVVILFYFFIFVFALIAYQIFGVREDIKYDDGRPYFKDYMDCVWDLYVLVTTSNNPDVAIPALKKTRFYGVFFFVYIFVCYYMLLNVFLAVAYHSYHTNIMVEVERSLDAKRRKLGQAFEVIKVNENGQDMVTYKAWKRLMNLAQPKLSNNQIDLLMLVLNTKRSGYIDRSEFMNVADLLHVPISEVDDRTTWLEKTFPNVYLSFPSESIKAIVDTIYFKFAYDLLVGVEIFLIGFGVPGIDIPFCALYIFEIGLKVYTYGPAKYFKRTSNWFDVVISVLCLIFLIVDTPFPMTDRHKEDVFRETTRAVNVIRIFRILRLLVHIKRFKIIINTLIHISLSIFIYCIIIFIFLYVFNVIGMELFKGKIRPMTNVTANDSSEEYCGAPEIAGSEYLKANYCDLNFNDFISSTLVLATLLFENNWHILADGFVLVTNKMSRMYFAVFYMFVTVITINIITAFVLDMFLYEYRMQQEGKKDSAVEKKIKELGLGIDDETGLEISQPLSKEQLQGWMQGHDVKAPSIHPWIAKATTGGVRHGGVQLTAFSSYVQKRQSSYPTLNKFDGIRFHIKKKGWTNVEVLLQQLYESEHDSNTVKDKENTTPVRLSSKF